MDVPASSRWWILTLLIVGTLLLISALALDRPNVVWQAHEPHCPHCRHVVSEFSNRCADCRGEFDWVIAGQEQSPISQDSLSALDAEWLHARVEELGLETAAKRVAEITGLSEEAAAEYVQTVGRGDCGCCGGTKRDLASEKPEQKEPCPCCFGTGNSVACDGDRRVRLGDPTARRAYLAYAEELDDLLSSEAAPSDRAKEARRLAEEFLLLHAGSAEAARILFWGDVLSPPENNGGRPRRTTDVATQRLELVRKALRAAP
jgi:predicted amidophosphoribosyltransferase